MSATEWLQIIQAISNTGAILIGIKVLRYLNTIEFKVNLMWSVFSKRFGTRTKDDEQFLGPVTREQQD